MKQKRNCKVTALVAGVLLLAGCSNSKNMYYWGSYQETVYQYYVSGETSPQEQIELLKKDIEKAKAQNLPVPPGFYAQMGLLYNNIGNKTEAANYFESEKRNFPESAPFIDFLMNKKTGGAK